VKTIKTSAIVLSRTDYQEADRIINFLTADQGKIALMARGVRKPKSKLASGIELFSVNSISFIKGRGDIGTLLSARADILYSNIVHDIDRVQCGYNMIKLLNKATEDHTEAGYFDALKDSLNALNNPDLNYQFVEAWFSAQMLNISGHAPNLLTDQAGQVLQAEKKYKFVIDSMCFEASDTGNFSVNTIKCLRLMFSPNKPQTIIKINGFSDNLNLIISTLRQMNQFYLS